MSIDKRLISTGAAVCTADTLDIFEDSSCVALYGLNYDGSDAGGNYNGTPTNVTFNAPGYIDYAASFNGSSSLISAPNNSLLTQTQFSVSVWVNHNSASSYRTIISNYGYTVANGESGWIIVLNAGKVRVFNVVSGASYYVDSTASVPGGVFTNIAVTNTQSQVKIYINGLLDSTHTMNGFVFNLAINNYLTIGAYKYDAAGSPNSIFSGKIDQLRIFNKALSSSEVTTLYGETSCEYTCTTDTNGFPASASSDLVAYYKLDNDATDETGTYNGTETSITYDGGRYGASAVFNGSSSVINTSYTPTVANLRTVSFWFKTNATTFAVMQSVGPYGGGSGYTWEWIYILADGRITGGYGANNGGAVYQKATTESFNDDNWHHLALTLNGVYGTGSSVKLYIDGVEPSTTTDTTWNTSISTIQGTFTLGALKEYSGTNYYYTGELDQVRIFSKELSSTEVSSLYEDEHQCYITVNSTDPFGDSSNVALYEFENNANDSTGSYNGTASNVTYSTDSIIGTYAGSFNGTNSKIVNTSFNAITGNAARSISFWYKTTNDDDTLVTLGSTTGAPNNQFSIVLYTSSIGIYGLTGPYDEVITGWTNDLTSGVWQHLVVTWDGQTGGTLKAYLNGNQEIKTLTRSAGKAYATTAGLQLGNWGNNDRYYNGKLDQVRIFNKELNVNEVWQLYAEGAKG
jgi:hypothetical protein